VTSLGLWAGAANALTTPCSFGGFIGPAACTSGPYSSTPLGDKTLTELVAPDAGLGTITFSEEMGVGGPDSYHFSVDFSPPLTTPPGPISGTTQYKISIDPLNPNHFEKVSLSWSGNGSPTVIKRVYSDAFTTLLATITVDGGSYNLSQPYKNLWISDSYLVPNDGISNLDNFQNTYTQHNNVPGPLPLFGAAAAFSFSRRLRRRSVRPARLG
jgi:hypothetical protein